MKKLISLLLVVLLAFSFIACSDSTTSSSEDSLPQEKPQNGRLVCGFSCVDEIRMFAFSGFYNGKVEVNKNKEYVTEGETSAKFTFDGFSTGIPQVDIWSDSKFFGGKDFTKVQALTMDVFNPSDETVSISMSFTTSKAGDRKEYKKYTEKKFAIKPGKNILSYVIDRTVAASVCDMKHVEYVTLKFQEIGTKYSIYVDNLRIHETDEPVVPMIKEYKENELLLFNDSADRFFVDTVSWMSSAATLPSLSICRNPDYISEGSGSLMVTFSDSVGWGASETPCFFISGEPMTRIDFSEYSKVKFTLFSNCGKYVSVRFWDANGLHFMCTPWQDAGYGYNPSKDKTAYELEINISQLIDNGLDVTKLTRMEFFYGQQVGAGNAIFIDDIKLVK